jgi:hypothetical protein
MAAKSKAWKWAKWGGIGYLGVGVMFDVAWATEANDWSQILSSQGIWYILAWPFHLKELMAVMQSIRPFSSQSSSGGGTTAPPLDTTTDVKEPGGAIAPIT